LALPVIAVVFFGSFGFERKEIRSGRQATVASVPMRQPPPKPITKIEIKEPNKVHRQIATMDIHELMDQFDAPRIVLQAPVAPMASPAATLVVTLPSTIVIPCAITAGADAKLDEKAKGTMSSLWAKLKRTPKASNPFGNSADAEPAVEKIAVDTPTAPAPPAPPAPTAVVPVVKKLELTQNRVAKTSDAKADFQFAAAKTDNQSESRPTWTSEPLKRTGNTRREVVKTEAYAATDECYRAADVYLWIKTYNYVRDLQGLPYQDGELPSVSFPNGMIYADGQPFATGKSNPAWIDSRPNYLKSLGISIDFIRRELVAKDPKNKNETREYLEMVESSVGRMQQLYVQMEFTPATDSEIKKMLEAATRRGRFGMVGVGAGSVLGLLSMVWGLLKLDTVTKGYYSKWLFLGIPATLMGGFGLLVIFMETLGEQ
jgi:hypothetical protein